MSLDDKIDDKQNMHTSEIIWIECFGATNWLERSTDPEYPGVF